MSKQARTVIHCPTHDDVTITAPVVHGALVLSVFECPLCARLGASEPEPEPAGPWPDPLDVFGALLLGGFIAWMAVELWGAVQ